MELTGFGPCLPQFLPLGQPELNSRPPGVSSTVQPLALTLSAAAAAAAPHTPCTHPQSNPSQRLWSGGKWGATGFGVHISWLQLRNWLTPSSCPWSWSVVLLCSVACCRWERNTGSCMRICWYLWGPQHKWKTPCNQVTSNRCCIHLKSVESTSVLQELRFWESRIVSDLPATTASYTDHCTDIDSCTLIDTPSRSMCLRTHSLAGIEALIYTHGVTHIDERAYAHIHSSWVSDLICTFSHTLKPAAVDRHIREHANTPRRSAPWWTAALMRSDRIGCFLSFPLAFPPSGDTHRCLGERDPASCGCVQGQLVKTGRWRPRVKKRRRRRHQLLSVGVNSTSRRTQRYANDKQRISGISCIPFQVNAPQRARLTRWLRSEVASIPMLRLREGHTYLQRNKSKESWLNFDICTFQISKPAHIQGFCFLFGVRPVFV